MEEIFVPKSRDFVDSKQESVSLDNKTKKDNIDEKDFVWGIKQSGNKYKSVTIRNELYSLNDCVSCRSGLELDYIGKIMKLFQDHDKKVCTLRWFFRPFELPTSLENIYKTANTRELFLAFGEGKGVENENFLVSCFNTSNIRSFYNVENVVSLEVITRKCKVLCTTKDDFNDVPSNESLNMCDFFFNRAFNCDTLEIIGLDGVVDAIGAQKVYNKKEWLNCNKDDIHSNTFASSLEIGVECKMFNSPTLAITPRDILPLSHYNSTPSITEQSITRKLIEKRKRDSYEKSLPLQKSKKQNKKMKPSPPLESPKFPLIVTISNEEDQAAKSTSEVRSSVTIIDVVNASTPSHGPKHFEVSLSTSQKMENSNCEGGKMDENFKNITKLSCNTPMIIEQIGNNVDDIHVTCEGFPMENYFEPLEKSESSTSKLQKDESILKLTTSKHGKSESGEPLPTKKTQATLAREQKKIASKGSKNKTNNKPTNADTNSTSKGLAKRKVTSSKRVQNKKICKINVNPQDQKEDTSNTHDFQKVSKEFSKEHGYHCLKDQQPLELHLDDAIVQVGQTKRKYTKVELSQDVIVVKSTQFGDFKNIHEDLKDQQLLEISLVNDTSKQCFVKKENPIYKKDPNLTSKTLYSHDCQEHCIEIKHKSACLEDQQPLKLPIATTICEDLLVEDSFENSPRIKTFTKTSINETTIPTKQKLEQNYEDWSHGFQKAITSKRVLLLNNIDPELHSTELQEALSAFLETTCQVQKLIPFSFCYSTASALLKLTSPAIAQKSLHQLCKDFLMIGDRTIIATVCEDLEFENEDYCFHGHIFDHLKYDPSEKNCTELNMLPHFAEGSTIEFTFGLQWRLLQEQHELQWQMLNDLHEKELYLSIEETKTNKQIKRSS